jgi:hypothetical protein
MPSYPKRLKENVKGNLIQKIKRTIPPKLFAIKVFTGKEKIC